MRFRRNRGGAERLEGVAITLVPRRAFQLDGSQLTEAHGVAVRLAGIERVLLDGATMPGRVGGVFGLARIVDRGAEQADWRRFVQLGEEDQPGSGGGPPDRGSA